MTDPAHTLGGYVDRGVAHALTVLQPAFPGSDLAECDCEVHLFKQSWGNTACGWPGIAGRAFTDAYTVVVVGPQGDAAVYLGRPAYYLPSDIGSTAKRDKFYECLTARRMPAVRDCATVACRKF